MSSDSRAIITATVPILEQGGEALTRHFYKNLFRDHPEVLPYFNQAHQHSGDQQRALANGVLMYAKHIDQLAALGRHDEACAEFAQAAALTGNAREREVLQARAAAGGGPA